MTRKSFLLAFVGAVLSKVYKERAVTSDLAVSSKIGNKILEKGGNSVDAAIATAVAVGAINAFASGIGGGGFMLVRQPDGAMRGYNFRETAPALAEPGRYRVRGDSLRGRRSVAVPGEIRGLYMAHKEHGKMKWAELFHDTIEMLESGFEVPPVLGDKLREFEDVILKDKGLFDTYTKKGKVVRAGDVITRKNFAKTLSVLARDPESFYTGEIAKSLLSFINQNGECITASDFSGYAAVETSPLIFQHDNLTISTLGIPTCGYMGIVALLSMKLVSSEHPVLSEKEFQNLLIVLYSHLYHIRKGLEDTRDEHLNRKDLNAKVFNTAYISKLLMLLKSSVDSDVGLFAESAQELLVDHGTTHVNVVDKDGMMVSLTSTINNYWGSGLMDPSTGVILNDQIDDFLFQYTNMNGLSGDREDVASHVLKNTILAHRRPLSSSMPIIVQDGKNFYITGGSGGIRIPTTVISVLSRIMFRNTPIGEAVDFPRVHMQGGNKVYVERAYPRKHLSRGLEVVLDNPMKIHSCLHIISANYSSAKGCRIETATDGRKKGGCAGV